MEALNLEQVPTSRRPTNQRPMNFGFAQQSAQRTNSQQQNAQVQDFQAENKQLGFALDQIKDAFWKTMNKTKSITEQKDAQIKKLQDEIAQLKSQIEGKENNENSNITPQERTKAKITAGLSSPAIQKVSPEDIAFKDKRIKELQKALDESHNFTRELSKELFHMHKKFKEMGVSQPTQQEKNQALSSEDQTNYNNMIAELQEQIQKSKKELISSNEKLSEAIKKEEKEHNQYLKEIQVLKHENENLKQQNGDLLHQLNQAKYTDNPTENSQETEIQLQRMEQELKKAKDENSQLHNDNVALITRLKEVTQEMESMKSTGITQAPGEFNPAQDAESKKIIDSLTLKLKQVNNQIENLQSRLNIADQRAATYQSQLAQQKVKFENNAQFLLEAREENCQLRNENSILKKDNEKLAKQLSIQLKSGDKKKTEENETPPPQEESQQQEAN